MKICDVVLNSIWFDPRVRKQIAEYQANDQEVVAVGLKCPRYDEEKVKRIPCDATIVKIDEKYDGKQYGLFRKLKRERLRSKGIESAILHYKPDVIHANDLNALILVYRASKKLKCKLIYDSHEVNVENYMRKRPKAAGILHMIEKYLVRRVDLMLCVSHAAAEYFADTYGIPKPMVVTNCALKRETLTTVPSKHAGFEILNHGQFYKGRGYEEMIGAAALLKEYPEIKIAVRGFGALEETMRKQVEDNHLENCIFYPPVHVEQLIPEAAASHVGVAFTEPICLNFKLSVSNKLFEYAAAGLPVIMSDIPEHRYLNEQYHFGLILSENTPHALAEAIKKLYTDRTLYEELAANSRKMSQEINWENEFGKLIQAEEAMMGAKT